MTKLLAATGLMICLTAPAQGAEVMNAKLFGTFTGTVTSGEEAIQTFFDGTIRTPLTGRTFVLDAAIDGSEEDGFDSAHMYLADGVGPSGGGAFDPVFGSLSGDYANGVLRLFVGASDVFGNDSGTTTLFADRIGGQFVNWRGSVWMGGQTGVGETWDTQAVMNSLTFDGTFSGAVPEPATWAMMIAGFGLAGASLRRNRAVALG